MKSTEAIGWRIVALVWGCLMNFFWITNIVEHGFDWNTVFTLITMGIGALCVYVLVFMEQK